MLIKNINLKFNLTVRSIKKKKKQKQSPVGVLVNKCSDIYSLQPVTLLKQVFIPVEVFSGRTTPYDCF